MKTLVIRFVNGSGFVSDAIDWATNSLWDHVEIGTEEGTWIGARADGGVQERSGNYCVPTRERRYGFPVEDAVHARIMAYARGKIGTGYDYADIAGLLIHDRALHSPDLVICSKFTNDACEAGPFPLVNDEPQYSYLLTPESLHLSLVFRGHCIYEHPHPFPPQ